MPSSSVIYWNFHLSTWRIDKIVHFKSNDKLMWCGFLFLNGLRCCKLNIDSFHGVTVKMPQEFCKLDVLGCTPRTQRPKPFFREFTEDSIFAVVTMIRGFPRGVSVHFSCFFPNFSRYSYSNIHWKRLGHQKIAKMESSDQKIPGQQLSEKARSFSHPWKMSKMGPEIEKIKNLIFSKFRR